MKLEQSTDIKTGERRITFTLTEREMQNVNLDPWDMRLLNEPEEQPADTLLKVEMLARRIWEQRPTN